MMPYEVDDLGLRVIGVGEPIQFYDDNRVLRQEISLNADGTLSIGSLNVGVPAAGGDDFPYGGNATFDNLSVGGRLTVGSGNLAGWEIEPSHLYSGDGSDRAGMMPGDYPFYAGAESPLSAPFYVTSSGAVTMTNLTSTGGTIGGWTIASTELSNTDIWLDADDKQIAINSQTFGNAGVQLEYNAGTPRAYIGDGDQRYLQFDGTNVEIGGSLIVRGQIETSVFSYQAIQAHAGSLLVTISSGRLLNDVTTVASPTTFDLDIEDPEYAHTQLFSSGDILRLRKTDGTDNWVEISSVTDNTTHYTYTCTLSDGSGTTFDAGTAVVDYGQSGDGYLYMSADDSEAPFYSVRTWATNPWTGGNITERARFGNMRNAFGTGANDRYGFGVGDFSGGDYLSYNAESSDSFIVSAGGGNIQLDGTSMKFSNNARYLKFYDSIGGDLTGEIGVSYETGRRVAVLYSKGLSGDILPDDPLAVVTTKADSGTQSYFELHPGYAVIYSASTDIADLRVEGGLYVGGVGTDPDTDDIHYDGDLRPVRSGTTYTGYTFVPLTTPITHTSFDGDSFSDVSTSTKIENTSWSTTIPSDAKALLMRVYARDSASESTNGLYFLIGPSATYYYSGGVHLQNVANDQFAVEAGQVVPCTNGDIWYQCDASGTGTLDVWLEAWGYWI
jgi:hypothetical protein